MLYGKTLHLDAAMAQDEIIETLKALASVPRWRILQQLSSGRQTVTAIAAALNLPASTAAVHIKILEEAGVLHTELQAAAHGLQKLCGRAYDSIVVQIPPRPELAANSVEITIPVGSYSRFEALPTCGLATAAALIGYVDDPVSFYEPERLHAGLIWFGSGFVEYTVPNRLPQGGALTALQISMELCSEAPLHNNQWPSDITLWVNDHEVGTWTCAGDFGGKRGQLTPSWWASGDTQYGLLKRWLITEAGSYIDGHPLSPLTAADLALADQRLIRLRVGVKPDALHQGGLNLFGKSFGNYPQDIVLRLDYTPGRSLPALSET